jgi:FtsP/CotA-like multicopper oxidase with cupredoxin domain
MARRTPLPTLELLALLGLLAPSAAAAQGGAMAGHDHAAMSPVGWRMPPMFPGMPMLPELMNAVPPVGAFLPGAGIDPTSIPAARPSEVVEMQDGDTLRIAASLVRRELSGHSFVMYGYNGQYPGPLIRAPRGATIVVVLTNEIELPTTIHWHGVRLDNRFDGVPGLTQAPVAAGESFTYQVHVPDSGLYWYHPHLREDVQQDLGLFGNLLVEGPDLDGLAPVHREEMLVLDDLLIDEQGMIAWGEQSPTHALMGRFGNLMLVNGEADPRIRVRRGEVVRFYLTNVANARTFNVVFGGARTKLLASDVGLFERESWTASVPIAPAERYVVDVRFDAPGQVAITNSIQAVNHWRGEFFPHVDTLAVVEVSEGAAEAGPGAAFDTLRDHPDVSADIDRFRTHFDRPPDYELETTLRVQGLPTPIVLMMEADTLYVPPMEWNDAMPMMNWLSTGTQVTWILEDVRTGAENEQIDWSFRQGDVVKIRVHNPADTFHPMNHPIHIHGQRFLVVSRDGRPATNLVWKDTAILPVGSTMDLIVDMSNPGDWMIHCHIAEHLHSGMMFDFVVEGG